MVKIRGCGNCSSPAAKDSMLCEDCKSKVSSRLKVRMVALEVENRQNLIRMAVVVKEQKKEIEKLEYSLKLRTKLLQKIFEEYQALLMDRKKDLIKIDAINRAFL